MKLTSGFYEILPGQLYQGKKMHRMAAEPKAALMQQYGITHAVALAPPVPDLDLLELPAFTNFPIPDGRVKQGDELLVLAAGLAAEIEAGGCVLTMCNAGRNRSGLLSALIVRELSGISGAAAMEVVRLHRPRALANDHFEAFLRSLP